MSVTVLFPLAMPPVKPIIMRASSSVSPDILDSSEYLFRQPEFSRWVLHTHDTDSRLDRIREAEFETRHVCHTRSHNSLSTSLPLRLHASTHRELQQADVQPVFV